MRPTARADTGTVATAGPATTGAAAARRRARSRATSIATETSGAATSAAAAPSGEPVVIGVLTSLTGPFTPWGVQVRDGMQLAVASCAAGGIAGRPVELSVVDDQSNPEAPSGIERLAEEGVVAIGGIISSDVGLATSRVCRAAGPAVPRQGRLGGHPHPAEPAHVPHVPAGRPDGGGPITNARSRKG